MVGQSVFLNGAELANEWTDGSAVTLGALPSFPSGLALAANAVGLAVGISVSPPTVPMMRQPSGGASVINLGLGGTHSTNDAGQVVGVGPGVATEWSDGRIVNLEAGRAPRLALPMVSMTPDRWWAQPSITPMSPLSGPTAASST